ncbi:MAG TPA: tetratricopeptide repeat protein [Xanthomonadales bacterium]
MSFFNELKRRNVFKVGIAYVVVAWLVAQVLQLVFESFGTPDWVMKTVLVLLATGTPFAIFFAWAFEMTPEGLKRESEVDRSQSITHETGQKLNHTIIAVLVLALGYFAYDKFVLNPGRDAALVEATTQAASEQAAIEQMASEPEEAPEDDKSIAVLPFADMSPDKNQEYFSDGLSEELLNLLAKIPELRVAARTSAWSYKGKDVKIDQVGKELGVAHVLEGSVRTSGNRIRVTAQLIKADDGFHLWSETYDRTLDDVFAIQDEISGAVVAALKVTLLGEAPHVKQISSEAYALYLQAQHISNQLRRDLYQNAVDLYQKVLAIEPGYAPAWVGISRNYRNMAVEGLLNEAEGMQMAVDAVNMALQLDPDLAEAHARLGLLYLIHEQDTLKAANHFKIAMELNPNDPAALQGVADFAASLGKFDISVRLGEAAVLRDPVDAVLQLHLGDYYRCAERFDDAVETFKNAITLNPEISAGHYKLGVVLLATDKPDAALAEFLLDTDEEYALKGRALSFHALSRTEDFESSFTELRERYGKQWPSEIAHVYAWTGDQDAAFEWLDKAVAMNEGGIGLSRQELWLTPLHDDPRWQVFLEKIGVSDAQVATIDFEF